MTAAAPIAVVRDYCELIDALRVRRDDLALTHETIDHESGVQPGYTSKLLADPPLKHLGITSFGCIMGALRLKLLVVEDEGAKPRNWQTRLTTMRPIARMRLAPWLFTRENAREIARKQMSRIPKRKRIKNARKAAKARWRAA